MGRAAHLTACLVLGLAAAILGDEPAAAGAEEPPPSFPVRIVRLGGPLGSESVSRHIDFSISIGFNAIWISASQAGSWLPGEQRERARLSEQFLQFAAWCRVRGIRLFVVLDPVAESDGSFVFDEAGDYVDRIRRFARLLQRQAAVHDVVLSFQGAPLKLTELTDALRFGTAAATAHVDLAARLRRELPRAGRLWLAPAVFNDLHLADPRIPYSAALIESLSRLDRSIGVVWSGPEPESRSIEAGDLTRSRTVLGDRPLLLQDRFPANHAGARLALALVLGPLRNRAPEIVDEVAGYLSVPMAELGASRLALSTVADYLRIPGGYDPDYSWATAMKRLAGDDPQALAALRVQAVEWGGWIGERNYRTALTDNPEAAARALRDPAVVASWGWVVRRYPDRMAALAGLDDAPFRDELIETMGRRLAIARAVPLVRELRARQAAGRTDLAALTVQLRRERERPAEPESARQALERFLGFSGVLKLLADPE